MDRNKSVEMRGGQEREEGRRKGGRKDMIENVEVFVLVSLALTLVSGRDGLGASLGAEGREEEA
eukprot:766289-Hanusia_phi.AAC.4